MPAFPHRIRILVVACSVLMLPPPSDAQSRASDATSRVSIQVRDLGTLVPGGASAATAINNRGHVVGWATLDDPTDPNVPVREAPFVWTPQRGLQSIILDVVPDLFVGYALDINDRDDVIGEYFTFGGGGGSFLWSVQDGFIDLGSEFVPVAINNRRQIIGVCPGPRVDEEFERAFACLWEGGIVRSLIDLGGLFYSFRDGAFYVVGINERGEVPLAINASAWLLWTPTKGVVKLPLVSAIDINNSGQIVGYTADHTVVLSRHGSILRERPRDLGPTAINSRGWVTGDHYVEGTLLAFLWRRDNVILTLPPPLGARGSSGIDINNRGQIVGHTTIDDRWRAVMWTLRASNAQKK